MATPRKGDWIQTFTLRQFWPTDPRVEDIDLTDIAHALSLVCRFAGHVRWHYSVAQHSVLVSRRAAVLVRNPEGSLLAARWGLLHDASEAYIADVASPVKRLPELAPYRAAEATIQAVVMEAFGLPGVEPPAVREADMELLYTEARDLFSGVNPNWHWLKVPLEARIERWSPERAESEFMARFADLFPKFAKGAG